MGGIECESLSAASVDGRQSLVCCVGRHTFRQACRQAFKAQCIKDFDVEIIFEVKIAILPKSKMAAIHLRDHNFVSFYWIFKCNASKTSVFWV